MASSNNGLFSKVKRSFEQANNQSEEAGVEQHKFDFEIPYTPLEEEVRHNRADTDVELNQDQSQSELLQQKLDYVRRRGIKQVEVAEANDNVRASIEREMRYEFQAKLDAMREKLKRHYESKRKQQLQVVIGKVTEELQEQFAKKQAAYRAELHARLESENEMYLSNMVERYQADYEMERTKLQNEFAERLQHAVNVQKDKMRAEYVHAMEQANRELKQKCDIIVSHEQKQLQQKYAREKGDLIQELTSRFEQEKKTAMEEYATQLRDKLYKEMVKQKEYIQNKFASNQAAALQEQKRRLDAQYKQEIAKITHGLDDSQQLDDLTAVVFRGTHPEQQCSYVEELADGILAKLGTNQ